MPTSADDTRYWLSNMVIGHGFSAREIALATGIPESEVSAILDQYRDPDNAVLTPETSEALSILPYPGGRHPRRGFQDGALLPQRETKVSVFAPWDSRSYAVADVPEAILSNLGRIYLAHTHVPTVWDLRGVKLEQLEWRRDPRGTLSISRQLPDGIEFGVRAEAHKTSVSFRLWLKNRGSRPLTRLRVQNCVLLGRLAGFDTQTNRNKVFQAPYVACQCANEGRWIIVASNPCWRVWGNPLCPCIHADARFPDCEPGATSECSLWIWFYTGTDIHHEFCRLGSSSWQLS